MHRMNVICAALALLLVSSAFVLTNPEEAPARATVYQEDFEDGQAQGWDLAPGWQVEPDGGNQVLAGQGHVWARGGEFFEGDVRQSFRVKLLQGRVHIVVRLTSTARYFIGFDAAGSDLNKQYFPSEFHEGLAGKPQAHALDRWYQLEVTLEGNTVGLWVDGVQQWSYTDSQPLVEGSFAFETLDGSRVHVDDIAVDLPGAQDPAAAPSPLASPAQAASPASLTWVRTGGPLGGLGYDVRMRPGNPDEMLVTDAWAGVFMSQDGGANWLPNNGGVTTRVGPTGDGIPVFCVTYDPNDPSTVWLGTQNLRGIFKSVDGGQTWKETDNGVVESVGITFRGFSVVPGDSNVVYAAAEISSWAWAGRGQNGKNFDMTRGVVYKTVNGGQSWSAVWRGDNLARYVWIDPRNPSTLYISTGIFDREAANSVPSTSVPGGEGVLKSTDGGATWNHVNQGLGNLYVGSLFMHPSNPDVLLAGTGNNVYSHGAGVYLTTDGALSWTRTLKTEPYNIEAVEFSTSDPSVAYAGSDLAFYRSQDGGRTWSTVAGGNWGPPGVTAGFPIDIQVDPRDPNRIFANEYGGGNFLSTDGGQSWTDASRGYTGALMRGSSADPSTPARIYAAARSGLFVSHDGGTTWQGLGFPPMRGNDWTEVAVDPGNPQHIIAYSGWNGLGSSMDGGRTWTIVAPCPSDTTAFRTIAFSPSEPSTVYAGIGAYFNVGVWDSTVPGQGVRVSHDGGKTWSAANSGLAQDAHVSSLVVHATDASIVYAATTNRGLLRSTDGAGSWTQLGGGLPAGSPILSFAISPGDPNVLLAGTERRALYRSTDGGDTWKRAASGLNPEASVTDIVFDPGQSGLVVYLSDMFGGVFRSLDGGLTWSGINQGLGSRAVNALSISGDGLHLYAGTEGSGMYRLDLNGQPPEPAAPPVPTSTATVVSNLGPAAATPEPTATSATSAPAERGRPFCSSPVVPLGLMIVALARTKRRSTASSSRGGQSPRA